MTVRIDIPEHVKIRNYLMDLIYHADSVTWKLPSSRVLAERFGVARTTVTNVMNELSAEGYLRLKHGKGAYLNPERMFHALGVKPFPVIDFLVGKGDHFFHDWSSWSPMALTGVYLEDQAFHLRTLRTAGYSPAQIVGEMRSLHSDGLVWFNPPDEVEPLVGELFAEGFPTLVVFNRFESAPCVGVEPEADGHRLGKFLLAEGRRSLFFALDFGTYSTGVLAGLRRAYREGGHELEERLIFRDKVNFRRDLHAALEAGAVPDAFYIQGGLTATVMAILQEHGVDIQERCRLVADRMAEGLPGFRGITKRPPFEEIGRKCAAMMVRMVRDGDRSREQALFGFSMMFNGKEI